MVWKSSHLSMVTVAKAESMWYLSAVSPFLAFFSSSFSTACAARPVDWCVTDGCSASIWFSMNLPVRVLDHAEAVRHHLDLARGRAVAHVVERHDRLAEELLQSRAG